MKNCTFFLALLLGFSTLQAQIYVDINASGANDKTTKGISMQPIVNK